MQTCVSVPTTYMRLLRGATLNTFRRRSTCGWRREWPYHRDIPRWLLAVSPGRTSHLGQFVMQYIGSGYATHARRTYQFNRHGCLMTDTSLWRGLMAETGAITKESHHHIWTHHHNYPQRIWFFSVNVITHNLHGDSKYFM